MVIEIIVNGETQEAEAAITLGELIRKLGFHPESVAALVNDAIIERDRVEEVCLESGDAIELVRFVSGG